MPSIPIHPPDKGRNSLGANSSLPQILRMPSGLAILELQGDFNVSAMSQERSSEATSIGKIIFPDYDGTNTSDDASWQKRVYMYVGKHQRLTGEVKKLSRPIALLQKRTTANPLPDGEELEIAEIIYYKLLFAHRPEPVGGGGSGADG